MKFSSFLLLIILIMGFVTPTVTLAGDGPELSKQLRAKVKAILGDLSPAEREALKEEFQKMPLAARIKFLKKMLQVDEMTPQYQEQKQKMMRLIKNLRRKHGPALKKLRKHIKHALFKWFTMPQAAKENLIAGILKDVIAAYNKHTGAKTDNNRIVLQTEAGPLTVDFEIVKKACDKKHVAGPELWKKWKKRFAHKHNKKAFAKKRHHVQSLKKKIKILRKKAKTFRKKAKKFAKKAKKLAKKVKAKHKMQDKKQAFVKMAKNHLSPQLFTKFERFISALSPDERNSVKKFFKKWKSKQGKKNKHKIKRKFKFKVRGERPWHKKMLKKHHPRLYKALKKMSPRERKQLRKKMGKVLRKHLKKHFKAHGKHPWKKRFHARHHRPYAQHHRPWKKRFHARHHRPYAQHHRRFDTYGKRPWKKRFQEKQCAPQCPPESYKPKPWKKRFQEKQCAPQCPPESYKPKPWKKRFQEKQCEPQCPPESYKPKPWKKGFQKQHAEKPRYRFQDRPKQEHFRQQRLRRKLHNLEKRLKRMQKEIQKLNSAF